MMPFKDQIKRRTYHKAYMKKWYAKNKNLQIEYMRHRKNNMGKWLDSIKSSLKCEECGQDHPATLDFHHKDPTTKKFNLSKRGCISQGFGKKKVLEEIKKCIVLCSNCHRILHWGNRKKHALVDQPIMSSRKPDVLTTIRQPLTMSPMGVEPKSPAHCEVFYQLN